MEGSKKSKSSCDKNFMVITISINLCNKYIMDIHEIIFNDNKFTNLSNLPKILYINLDRAKERNKIMIDEFKKYNITNYERIQGCDYKDGNIRYRGNNKQKPAEYYCLFSHMKALRYFLENTKEREVLICEDDVSFELTKFYKKKLTDYLREIPSNYDVVNLLDSKVTGVKLKKNIKYQYFTACYLISRKGAKKVLNKFDKLNYMFLRTDINYVADHFIFYDYDEEFISYVYGLVTYKNNDSFIHQNHVDNCHKRVKDSCINLFLNYKLFA